MASILSRNPLPPQRASNPFTPNGMVPNGGADPVAQINAVIQQILSCSDPAAAFQQIISSSPEAQNAMNIITQYGNGDPKAAFENYAAAQGKQALAGPILQKLGLG